MVYLVAKGEIEGKVLAVRVDKIEEVAERVRLNDGEHIIGSLTTSDIRSLDASQFIVITA